MEIQIDLAALRQTKLFIATPQYGGMCTGQYQKSMMQFMDFARTYGLQFVYWSLQNESLITRARNYCAEIFMQSDCTHLMFIDSDIEFSPEDIITLWHYSIKETDKDIVCGPYPKKNISWEKIVTAVNNGLADKDPTILENFVGDFVFNPVKGGSVSLKEPIEVLESGTGFMMIRRETFNRFKSAHPELSYLPDHVRTEGFAGEKEIMAYFDCVIDPVSKRYLSEDYFFCQECRKLGMHVWLIPWIKLNHVGTYIFKGDLVSIAKIGESITADPEKLKKK
jgi:hypothetical protein